MVQASRKHWRSLLALTRYELNHSTHVYIYIYIYIYIIYIYIYASPRGSRCFVETGRASIFDACSRLQVNCLFCSVTSSCSSWRQSECSGSCWSFEMLIAVWWRKLVSDSSSRPRVSFSFHCSVFLYFSPLLQGNM